MISKVFRYIGRKPIDRIYTITNNMEQSKRFREKVVFCVFISPTPGDAYCLL